MINNHATNIKWQEKGDEILKSYYGKYIGRTKDYNSWATDIGLALRDALIENEKVTRRMTVSK